jgi:hypothetical protein
MDDDMSLQDDPVCNAQVRRIAVEHDTLVDANVPGCRP